MGNNQGHSLTIEIDGSKAVVACGTTVAAAVLSHERNTPSLRRSVSGSARGPLCGMGICFECRVTINGIARQRACMVECDEGMRIQTDAR